MQKYKCPGCGMIIEAEPWGIEDCPCGAYLWWDSYETVDEDGYIDEVPEPHWTTSDHKDHFAILIDENETKV